MAIQGALSIARSGLIATGEAMSVTGHNIANVNTVGYKSSRSEFAEVLSSSAGGGPGAGMGVQMRGASSNFSGGSIESTGRSTDLAVEGRGLFVLRDGESVVYSRAGDFRRQADNQLVNNSGLVVQGYALDDEGQVVGGLTDIDLGSSGSQPTATTRIELTNNVSATAPEITGGFDGTDFDTAYASSSYTTTVRAFDTLGRAQNLTLFFTRTGANAWDVNVGVDAAATGGTPGNLAILGTASLTFDGTGALTAPAPTDVSVTFDGAEAQTFTLDFGTPSVSVGDGLGFDGVTQTGGATTLTVDQDGFPAGQLAEVSVDAQGVVTGIFDNGQTRPLYRIAVAGFAAPDGLEAMGGGLYRETASSGPATVGGAGEGGLGRIVAAALERSNVELAQEFVDLIALQRSFQANARMVTTSDSLLSDLISIVR